MIKKLIALIIATIPFAILLYGIATHNYILCIAMFILPFILVFTSIIYQEFLK